ncbi:hypothetical protein [Actinosynnema mirum]|uniref:hypothetical protein n=1 Tax=Actinosynnema mirum TaxID=40567 RepID=UPI0016512ED1|nr:hypothetical protein [Actinosynnema mirum]
MTETSLSSRSYSNSSLPPSGDVRVLGRSKCVLLSVLVAPFASRYSTWLPSPSYRQRSTAPSGPGRAPRAW